MAETVRGLNIKLGLDGKDLDNELKEIKVDLREQQKDLKAINSQLKYDSSNVELWKNKQSKLNEILQTTKKRLETQNVQLEKAKEAVKVGSMSEAEYNKLKRNVMYTEAEVVKLNSQLQTTKEKISSLGNVNFDKIGKLGSTLTKSITVPALGAVSALGALSIKSAYTADSIGDTAAKLGLSAEQLQEWQHTATIMGSSTESLNKAFIKVNGILGEIATGNADRVADELAAIGLTVDDLKGKGTNEAFEMIRKALSGVSDEAIRVGVANEFFGEKIGSEILPILSSETDAIESLRKEAHELGIVTNEQAETAGYFTDTLDRTKQALSSLVIDLSMSVLPIIETFIAKLKDEVIPTVKGWIAKWNELDEGTKKIIYILGAIVVAVGPVLSIIGKVGPGLHIVSAALKGVGISGLFAGAGLNFATLGIGTLIAILATALLSSEEFRAILMKLGETFIQLLMPIMDIIMTLVNALQPILDVIINLVVRLVEILMPIIEILLQPFIEQLGFIAKLFELISPLIGIIGGLLQSILVPAINVLYTVLEPVLKIVEKIVEFLSKIFEWIGGLGEKVGDLAGNIGNRFKDITSNLGDFAKNVTSGVGNTVDNIKEKTGDFFKKVGGWFGDTFNLKQAKTSQITNNQSSNKTTTNNITINTSSTTFDIDSINRALGGNYL
jgi:phage-related minor tail protein